jgi:hypothetical protein
LLARVLSIAYEAPWEKQRQTRVLRAFYAGQLRLLGEPFWKHPQSGHPINEYRDPLTYIEDHAGLPPADGPGSNVSSRDWAELVSQNWLSESTLLANLPYRIARSQRERFATLLVVAVARYQADHEGSPPASLDTVIPAYLSELPINPIDGQSLSYRISKGETITARGRSATVAAGQALICTADADPLCFAVPIWPK